MKRNIFLLSRALQSLQCPVACSTFASSFFFALGYGFGQTFWNLFKNSHKYAFICSLATLQPPRERSNCQVSRSPPILFVKSICSFDSASKILQDEISFTLLSIQTPRSKPFFSELSKKKLCALPKFDFSICRRWKWTHAIRK